MKATLTLKPTPGPLPTCRETDRRSQGQIQGNSRISRTCDHTDTHLVRCSASREEVAVVVAMDRQVEDVGVVVERLLGAVAVVNVLRSDSDHKCYTLCVRLLKNTH